MGRQLTNITFEEWVTYVFDHPVVPDQYYPSWYYDDEADFWNGLETPAVTVAYLTRAFENAQEVFKPFSDAQLGQGLWFLVSNSSSDHMFALLDTSVPWLDRKQCIHSIYTLFEQFFAPRCTPHLSHFVEAEPGAGPLNVVCYMWWDLCPIYGKPDEPSRADLDKEILTLMQMILNLDSDACRESALHGLGHCHLYYPKQVETIIETFLQKYEPGQSKKGLPIPTLRPELRAYALRAKKGHVL